MTAPEPRLDAHDPLAKAAAEAVVAGDVEAVEQLLEEHPELAVARVVNGGERTLLHLFADYPGHRPRPREMVAALQDAGADINAPYVGESHSETALPTGCLPVAPGPASSRRRRWGSTID